MAQPNRTLITGGMVFDSMTGELKRQDIAHASSITHVMWACVLYESAKLLAIAEPDTGKFFPAEPVPAGRPQSRL